MLDAINWQRKCADDASTAITWAARVTKLFVKRKKKEHKQVSIKRFLKRNLAHVGMVQRMNALADKVQKQDSCYLCRDGC